VAAALKSLAKCKSDSIAFITTIRETIDDAVVVIEPYNPHLKGALLKECARVGLCKQCLGELMNVDLMDCLVALPGQLFYSMRISVCSILSWRTKTPTPSATPATAANKPYSSTF
jgi:hypothetical protein